MSCVVHMHAYIVQVPMHSSSFSSSITNTNFFCYISVLQNDDKRVSTPTPFDSTTGKLVEERAWVLGWINIRLSFKRESGTARHGNEWSNYTRRKQAITSAEKPTIELYEKLVFVLLTVEMFRKKREEITHLHCIDLHGIETVWN